MFLSQATATVERNTVKPVDLRFQLRCGPDGSVEPKGILIEATDEISVQLINQEMYTTDGTVIFPDDSIGTEYYISVWSMFSVQIVATEPGDTTVSITLTDGPVFMHSGTFWAGDKVTETLKQYHVWNIIDTVYGGIDISGSYITADKPIGVMAGSFLAEVGDGPADHLLEQMLPYNFWGKKFLLPSTPARKIGDIFRACAAVKSVLTMSTGETATINPGACQDYDVPTGQNPVLTSDMAIQVIIGISHIYFSLKTSVLFNKNVFCYDCTYFWQYKSIVNKNNLHHIHWIYNSSLNLPCL